MESGAEICPILRHVKLEKKGIQTMHYCSRKYLELRFIALPKSCLHRGGAALIVEAIVDDVDKLVALTNLLRRCNVNPVGRVAELHQVGTMRNLGKHT